MSKDEPTVKLEYGVFTFRGTKEKTVFIDIINVGKRPIKNIQIHFVYDYEVPQDATEAFKAQLGKAFKQATGAEPVQAEATGGRFSFITHKKDDDGPLPLGERRSYIFPPLRLPNLLSIVQSLSPERYHVELTLDGTEEKVMEGDVFGQFIEELSDHQ